LIVTRFARSVAVAPPSHAKHVSITSCVQPLAGSHASRVQGSPSAQLGAAPARQRPLEQLSAPLQGFPSSHSALVPQGWQPASGVLMQPVCALHMSTVQEFPSLQESGVPVWQKPPTQDSVPLHGLPSLHVPLVVQP
jgi:hypothetical protein